MERVLSDRFVLGDVIGSGGMAMVYLAWDRESESQVAVKILRSEYNEDSDFIRRFSMEAQAASRMSHPNIVNIYGAYQDGDVRYIVMEYVKGRTLKEVIRQTGRIKPQRAVQITLRILAAVDHAHKCHIIHRDIKPQNILVDTDGNIKVADFGIARATNASTQTYTDGSNVFGSVHYFSPEQASGQTADEKSDLYSVGVVLYEMLTGSVPFDGENPITVALKHVQEPPKSARLLEPDVSKGLDEVLLKSLDKEASCRYQTAADMASDLKRAIRTPRGGFVDMPAGAQTQAGKDKETFWKKVRLWAMVAVCVLALGLAVYYGNQLYRHFFVRMEMPNFVMLKLDDAVGYLEELNLEYQLEKRPSEDVRMGFVLEQYPLAGESVWPGDRVQIVVSAGKEQLVMPKLIDLTRSDAVRLIEENDLVLGDVTLEISTTTPGVVIGQSPSVNEWVKPGDRVNLRVSGESGTVPNLAGFTVEEAKDLLIASGFELGQVTEQISETDTPGAVLAQSAEPDSVQLMGMQVDITVASRAPITSRAQTTVVIQAPEGGVEVVCTLVESTGEREIYRAQMEEGNQSIKLDLDSLEPGTHVVRIYLDGELANEKEIEFVEES